MKAAGHIGVVVPGAGEKEIDLVLWPWGPGLPYKVDVYDSSGRLPRNQLSWPVAKGNT